MNIEVLKRIYQFKIKEYGDKMKLYGITAVLHIDINSLIRGLETSIEQFEEQINNYNGVIVDDHVLFMNRQNAELFIEWLNSLITIKALKGN